MKQAQDPPTAKRDSVCSNAASNKLHLAPTDLKREADPEIESLLTQPTGDPRLAQINRQMYLSLHALDVELRKEQQLAACQQPLSPQLQVQARDGSGAGNGYSSGPAVADAGSRAPSVGTTDPDRGSEAKSATARVPSSLASPSVGGNFGQPGSARKATLTPGSGGGNGATAPNILAGNDNDVIARRLRNAAEQETDPELRAKLWKEYTEYKQGTSAK